MLWLLVSAVFFQHSLCVWNGIKIRLLRWFGATVGHGVLVKPRVTIKFPWRLHLGNQVWIGEGVWIDNLARVTIGDNVCISQGALLLTGSHHYGKPGFDLMVKPVVLENGVWIGAKALVCPGVRVYASAVLTAGSVATQDIPTGTVYQGNPAVFKRNRPQPPENNPGS